MPLTTVDPEGYQEIADDYLAQNAADYLPETYTEEQIAFALKQEETGTPVAEVIRRMGVSEQTFYRWK